MASFVTTRPTTKMGPASAIILRRSHRSEKAGPPQGQSRIGSPLQCSKAGIRAIRERKAIAKDKERFPFIVIALMPFMRVLPTFAVCSQ